MGNAGLRWEDQRNVNQFFGSRRTHIDSQANRIHCGFTSFMPQKVTLWHRLKCAVENAAKVQRGTPVE